MYIIYCAATKYEKSKIIGRIDENIIITKVKKKYEK